ncbi:MAG TPA: hypothetical protein VNQ77_08405 [Frankiaceae bacterium]|nr:hypothetical protein [Frankiaceae bacterium]
MRTRAAVLVAFVAACSAMPATAAYAAECVKVVVDYGTLAGAPAGPNTRCVDVGEDGTAAEALHGRARYKGNFLCAIDGYPETGCGDEPPSPYWSFWVWRDGAWVYSNEGVGTFTVGDADKDGHPDPLGFRYHEVDKKAAPRANPSYPKPTTAPPRTSAPARTPASSAAPGRTASSGPGAGPAGPGATGPGATPGGTGTPVRIGAPPDPTGTASTGPATGPAATGPEVAPTEDAPGAFPSRDRERGFPVGAVAGGVLALGLLGAAAYRFRQPGSA